MRTRRLDWADVYHICTVTPPPPGVGESAMPAHVVYAYRADGRRVLLPNLDDTQLGEEELPRETAALRQLLEERRRPDWSPDARVEAHIARHETRYAQRYRTLTSPTFITVTAVIVLVVIIACTIAF
ncbi:hypothetical protein [Streptomyces sp. A1136]|uniref:hypothetical protein n=1 Tax=Streptomyces sp. A1136 TaxID=2563102 RepID=UPI00109E3B5E|nr:hypothetical protein [Streptomyces sp. A1136]THA49393.1 hypothetical protein E6R62_27700 [Streptomyces sp. A1136]